MCNSRSRCAGHTGKQLEKKHDSLREKSDALAVAESNLIVATKSNNTRSIKKFTNEVRTRKTSVKNLKTEIGHIQRSYDGTPTGRAQLEERIQACDPSEYPILHDRLVKGSAERSWRFNIHDAKKAGKSIKDLRSYAMGLGGDTFSDERNFSR